MKIIFNLLLNILLSTFFLLFTVQDSALLAKDTKWIEVSRTNQGRQWWDKSSLIKKQDGILNVYSKFRPNTQLSNADIFYSMDIDCIHDSYKDISVNGQTSKESSWHVSAGDKLIERIINQACLYKDK